MPANRIRTPFSDSLHDLLWQILVIGYCYLRHPRLTYFVISHRKALPNPAWPHHSTDKFLWRKVFDRDPASVVMSDKLAAKQLAKELCPDIGIPKTLWVGQSFEQIPPELLTGDAVVKANHGSGFFHIIRNGDYDRQQLIAKTRRWMSTEYGRYHGEWNYRGVERKLFVEEFLKDTSGAAVAEEAKVFVFGGVALCTSYFHDRLTDRARQSLYDINGNAYNFEQYMHYPVAIEPAPDSLSDTFEVAARLGAGRDHVRVDLYKIDGALYFSEFTFYNMAGRFGWGIQTEFPQLNRLWDLRRTWSLSQPKSGWR